MENMKTVVILLSDKRSGSTMLQDAICAHPRIQTLRYSPHTYLESQHWLKAAVLLERHPFLFDKGKKYKNYGSRGNAKVYIAELLKGNLENIDLPMDRKQLVFKGWDAICAKYANPIFFEKSPQHLAHWSALSLMLEWAQQTKDFNVKFIGLVRNPMSVQYSAFKLFRTAPHNRQYDWFNNYRNLLAFKSMIDSKDFHLIRYEDIVDTPKIEIRKFCEFIGIEFSTIMVSKIHGNSKAKWKDDQYFRLILDSSVKQMAISFGYSEESLMNVNSKRLPTFKSLLWVINTFVIRNKNLLINRLLIPLKLRIKKR